MFIKSIGDERGIRNSVTVDIKLIDRAFATFVENSIQMTPELPRVVKS